MTGLLALELQLQVSVAGLAVCGIQALEFLGLRLWSSRVVIRV